MQTTAVIAFGGNLGNVPETIQLALESLQKIDGITVVRCSGNYVTRAIGSHAGNDFINSAAMLEVTISPLELLQHLQQIEHQLGRVRTIHWGPRTLDIDLVRFGDLFVTYTDSTEYGEAEPDNPEPLPMVRQRMETRLARLILPHPACWYRRFVLDPWNELDQDWVHPLLRETVEQMHARLLQRPLRVGILNSSPTAESLMNVLRSVFHEDEVALQWTSATRRQTSSHQDDELEIELSAGVNVLPEHLSPRAIVFGEDDDDEQTLQDHAIQIIRAALDHPQRLD